MQVWERGFAFGAFDSNKPLDISGIANGNFVHINNGQQVLGIGIANGKGIDNIEEGNEVDD